MAKPSLVMKYYSSLISHYSSLITHQPSAIVDSELRGSIPERALSDED